jgi:hypothetical protein
MSMDEPAEERHMSYIYPIIGVLRKQGQIILLSASSAFAAKNYPGGRTSHYLYGIPVDEYNPHLQSTVGPRSDRAKLLLAAKCHVIDEIGGLKFISRRSIALTA